VLARRQRDAGEVDRLIDARPAAVSVYELDRVRPEVDCRRADVLQLEELGVVCRGLP
jgi:hypothetical protein